MFEIIEKEELASDSETVIKVIGVGGAGGNAGMFGNGGHGGNGADVTLQGTGGGVVRANTITIRAALGKGQNSPGLVREISSIPR